MMEISVLQGSTPPPDWQETGERVRKQKHQSLPISTAVSKQQQQAVQFIENFAA